MNEQAFFGLSAYHLAMMLVGAGVIVAFWLPRFLSGREPAASALLILFGIAIHWAMPDVSRALDPREAPKLWEVASELAVIVALFGTGIRIDDLAHYRRWRPTIRLLAAAMPLTIAAVALMGWAFAGMTLAGAILLGAVLAPTDPVLAGEVQVGPPTEGDEQPVRFTLTTEAGLNDGLAFPFVYLGLLLGSSGFSAAMLGEWLLVDVFYRIAAGVLGGAAVGWLLARVLFVIPRGNVLADTASGVLSIAGVLFCYGATELAEGYGFIACFVAGIVLRRVEAEHEFHGRLHSFNEAIELALTALLLLLVGATFPRLFGILDWAHAGIALGLIFLVRPIAGWVGLVRTGLAARERLFVAFYGIRGVGSIYYLAYAGSHLELVNEGQLWATILLTILLSTIVHGFTAGPIVDQVAKRRAQ